ncbi:MAG: magnesium transporter CorA family protein [Vicinamibacterales bacterium]
MVRVLVHRDGRTVEAPAIDPAWLRPGAPETFWADVGAPTDADRAVLLDVVGLHELAVEDALSEIHFPKIEAYDTFLYLILHGIAAGRAGDEGFVTLDVDFFLGRNFLVTVHHDPSRSIEQEWSICALHRPVLADGPAVVLHRVVDRLVDHYRPEVDGVEDRLDVLERRVFEDPRANPLREILGLKRDLASLRRVVLPQRDALARLARREFPQIPDTLAYGFRDVYDNLVRLADEATLFQDRVTTLLEAYLSVQSNRLNQVMKVLTVIATIFMPLTVLTGIYGMNVPLPAFPGGDGAQFWWLGGLMLAVSAVMLWGFRRMDWL